MVKRVMPDRTYIALHKSRHTLTGEWYDDATIGRGSYLRPKGTSGGRVLRDQMHDPYQTRCIGAVAGRLFRKAQGSIFDPPIDGVAAYEDCERTGTAYVLYTEPPL